MGTVSYDRPVPLPTGQRRGSIDLPEGPGPPWDDGRSSAVLAALALVAVLALGVAGVLTLLELVRAILPG